MMLSKLRYTSRITTELFSQSFATDIHLSSWKDRLSDGSRHLENFGESISLHILFVLIRVIKSGQTDSFSLLVVTTIGVIQVKHNVETKKIWHCHWFARLVLMSPSYTRDKEMWLKIAINQLWGRCLLLAIYSVQTSCRWKARLIHNIHSFLFLFSFFLISHCK